MYTILYIIILCFSGLACGVDGSDYFLSLLFMPEKPLLHYTVQVSYYIMFPEMACGEVGMDHL